MKKTQLTVIGRAHEYVKEYVSNGFDQCKAYMSVFKVCYDSAIGSASRFHHSPAAQEAFQAIIGDNICEYYRHRDGITLKAQELYDQAEDTKTRLAVLRFIAEIAGFGGKSDIVIDNRKVSITNKLDPDEMQSILDDLKRVTSMLYKDTGRQTGEVRTTIDLTPSAEHDSRKPNSGGGEGV